MAENSPNAPDYSFLAAFDQGIIKPRASFLYFVGLLLATVTSIVLPLVYLAFVGAVAWLVFLHATHDWTIIMEGGFVGGFYVLIAKLLAYFAPLFAGMLVVFFMLKPFFARRPKRAQPLALNPGSEPLFYAYVEKICRTVGAPIPSRIDLDCEHNAAAMPRGGLFSLLRNDLVLVIGLPLAATQTAGELAGVIAHEFGHFRQGTGRFLMYFVGRINAWLIRVAYERDAWDLWLDQWYARERDSRVVIVIVTAQVGIWFSRLILKGLVFFGVLIGGFMLRRMEYDADAYEIRLAGSAAFESSMRKLVTAGAAVQVAHGQMGASWKQYRTLPDNFPEYLRRQHAQLPEPARQQFFDRVGLTKTRWFDSHPSIADRIRQARRAGEPGIFHDDRPASELFVAFEYPCQFVTLLHYRDNLGIPINQSMLTPLQPEKPSAAAMAGNLPADQDAVGRYFFGVNRLLYPLRLNPPAPSADPAKDLAELNQITAGAGQIAGQLASRAKEYIQTTEQWLRARAAFRLAHEGVPVDPAAFGGSGLAIETAEQAAREAGRMREDLRESLHEVANALKRRLELGLTLVLAETEGADVAAIPADTLSKLVAEVNAGADEYARRRDVAESLNILNRMLQYRVGRGSSSAFARAVEKAAGELQAMAHQTQSAAAEPETKTGGLRLQSTQKFNPYNAQQELSEFARETKEWLDGYDAKIGQLVQAVERFNQAG